MKLRRVQRRQSKDDSDDGKKYSRNGKDNIK